MTISRCSKPAAGTLSLVGGYSWSVHFGVACLYARVRELELKSAPVVITATVPRSAIALATRSSDGEVVLVNPPASFEVHTDSPKEIEQAANADAATLDRAKPEDVFALALDDEDSWAGWTAEPTPDAA